MAKYTLELREIVDAGIPLFDFPYIFYDEKKRVDFERDFIRHFYFREIGCETVDRFKLYLEDKMRVVFPFYNKLLETSLIEYDLINNYDVTEKHEILREDEKKGGSVSSMVGLQTSDGNSKANATKEGDTITNTSNETRATQNENTATESQDVNNSTKETETDKTVNDQGSKTNNSNTEEKNASLKKFLDTPQGAIDLKDSKYLTSLNDDVDTKTALNVSAEFNKNNQQTEQTDRETVQNNAEHDSNTTRESTEDTQFTQVNAGKEKIVDNAENITHDEQTNRMDGNVRNAEKGTTKETFVRTMKGNIGVQTATDMLEKHINYQKTVSKILKMFFDECEDLFLMVY